MKLEISRKCPRRRVQDLTRHHTRARDDDASSTNRRTKKNMDSTTFSRAIELSASTFTTRRSRLLAAILPILGNADLLGGGLFTVKVFLANVAASAACAILAWVCIASKVVARKVFSALVRSREVSPRVWAWGVFSAMLSYTGKRVLYAVKNAETVAWLKYNLQQAESALYHLCFLCFHTCVSLVCVHLMLRRYQNSMYDESKRPMSNESSDADEIVISDDDDDEDEDDEDENESDDDGSEFAMKSRHTSLPSSTNSQRHGHEPPRKRKSPPSKSPSR